MWTKRVLLCRILNDNDVAQGHLDHNQMPYIPKYFGSMTGFGGLSGCNKHGDPSVLSTNRKLEHIRQSCTNVAAQNPQDIWILNRKRHLKNHIQWYWSEEFKDATQVTLLHVSTVAIQSISRRPLPSSSIRKRLKCEQWIGMAIQIQVPGTHYRVPDLMRSDTGTIFYS
jgi:hypothetical protein